ncbi:MAG: InlB B-repeat-containing protein [Acholeplasmatales bacterium]|nr:InlB B-repeat-containing protein [Acholeplasmatales bacterium]
MKKVLSIVSLIGFLILFLISCGNKSNNDNPNVEKSSSVSTTTQESKTSTSTSRENSTNTNNNGNYYNVVFKDYDGTILQSSSVKEGTTPSYDGVNPTRENDDDFSYTFSGWNPSLSNVNSDTVYVATYTKEDLPYQITINLNGGTTNTNLKTSFKTNKFSKDLLPFDLFKKGYKFKGYDYNNSLVFDENGNIINNYEMASNMIFKAVFEEAVSLIISYSIYNPKTNELIKIESNPDLIGDISKSNSYNYNTNVNLKADTNDGYEFIGWYYDGVNISTEANYNYMMWDDDIELEARFNYVIFNMHVFSNNPDLGEVMIRNGNSQTFYNEETLQRYYTESVTIAAKTTSSIRFLGWYDENNNLVSPNAVYTFNMVDKNYSLEAKWNNFNITYDLDGGINNYNNPTSYNVDMQNITLLNPTREGYTFVGWQYKSNIITSINTSNICYMNLKALWTYYTLTTNVNNSEAGSVSSYNNTKVTKDKSVTITAQANQGYTFVGWYDGDNLISDKPSYTFTMPDKNLSYIAKWIETPINLSKNIDEAGSVSIVGDRIIGKAVTITAQENPGYTFVGWYNGDTELTKELSYTFTMSMENITYEARFSINKYTITIDNQVEGVIITGITSGNEYEYNTEIFLTASNAPSGIFFVWTRDDDNSCFVGNKYTFKVPFKDLIITTFISNIYTREDNKIYFGSYPQTKITDDTLINELNTLAGDLPTASDTKAWTDYNYYIEDNITNFMFYQDIDYDNNGDYDYRGVYFTEYRPECYDYSSSDSYQDDNGYSFNTIYWFSYDPIEWNVLSESNGKALIIANLILDSQEYYPSNNYYSSFSHNGGTGYANNYELSNIRKFLNDNFYNTAFNDLQKLLIETIEVDNSVSSTGHSTNQYACNNTFDKMFLLSREEAITYYTLDSARMAKGTDYAKSQGLFVATSDSYQGNSFWWLRSPRYNQYYSANTAYNVDIDGGIDYGTVRSTYIGIRPVCWIIL